MAWFKASQSKVKCWRQCRQRYWFRYVEKLRRKFTPRPLQFGRMVHEMIEADANGKNPLKHLSMISKRDDKMFRSQREEYGEIVRDTRWIMTEYFNFWENHPDASKHIEYVELKGKSSEHSFELEIPDGKIVIVGKLDNIAKTPKTKMRWLAEHKSGRKIPNEDHRWRQLQSALYIKVVDMLGLPSLDGTLWDYIRSKPPTLPQMLKTGKPSAKALDTLPIAVMESLKEQGLNYKDTRFKPMMKVAEGNRRTYFQRVFTPVKENVVEFLFEDFLRSAREMASTHGDEKLVSMTIERHCEWCEYEPLCRAKLQNLDAKFIKKKDYIVSEKRPDEEPDLEG